MKRLTLLILTLWPWCVQAQVNLVPNHSFEDWDSCGVGVSTVDIASPWYNPARSSSDVFHNCANNPLGGVPNNIFGHQYPRTGDGMAGIIAHYWTGSFTNNSYTELISVELSDTLWGGVDYELTMWVNMANRSFGPMDHLGMYLSNDQIVVPDTFTFLLNYPAQLLADTVVGDTVTWSKMSTVYTAQGGEKHLTIGCFAPHLDSITVDSFPPPVSAPGVYYYIDDVSVTRVSPLPDVPNDILLYPSPNNAEFSVRYNFPQEETGILNIYDLLGRRLFSQRLGTGWGRRQFSTPWFANGTYLYEVELNGEILKRDKFQIVR